MKYNELKDKKGADLRKLSGEMRAELFQLHIKLKTAQLPDKSRIRKMRRDAARIHTKMTELGRQKSV